MRLVSREDSIVIFFEILHLSSSKAARCELPLAISIYNRAMCKTAIMLFMITKVLFTLFLCLYYLKIVLIRNLKAIILIYL